MGRWFAPAAPTWRMRSKSAAMTGSWPGRQPERRGISMTTQAQQINADEYKFGFHDDEAPAYKAKRGLNKEVVQQISDMKDEPSWMREFRLKALQNFELKANPSWGGD